MQTTHRVYFQDSSNMGCLGSEASDLVVTSPPYPMIEMWDSLFVGQNPKIGEALHNEQGLIAFELMHQELNPVWDEVYRILKPGGIACINIGDAARTIGGNFVLYPNHSFILACLLQKGFSPLPMILWRKQTNAPNKFMGSGMLPAGAYVTLEHEAILILRKGPKREFKKPDQRLLRRESAFFWEERNTWFSDVWTDLKGTGQSLSNGKTRLRSAAFPFELAYRLINMFSVKGDLVVDPFLGLGTTTFAAMASCRNSLGFETDPNFREEIVSKAVSMAPAANDYIRERIEKHLVFIKNRARSKGLFKHKNLPYGFPVVTLQERDLLLNRLLSVVHGPGDVITVEYDEKPQEEFCQNWDDLIVPEERPAVRHKQPKESPDS